MDEVESWFKRQYVQETLNRYSLAMGKGPTMILRWRCAPENSIWTCLPGKKVPTQWKQRPNEISLNVEAAAAWKQCDVAKAHELYAKWNHECKDPYYCPMHGIGSD